MAFTTRRGRPPRPAAAATDPGTPELRFKHAHGLTAEPIDLCLERQIITAAQHWCGLHLRWLYTLRYGAPGLTTRYDTYATPAHREPERADWRRLRETEYHEATALLRTRVHYEPVMRLCIYNETPAFLNPALVARSLHDAALTERLNLARERLTAGLEILAHHWQRR
jgi:hypothetical protein